MQSNDSCAVRNPDGVPLFIRVTRVAQLLTLGGPMSNPIELTVREFVPIELDTDGNEYAFARLHVALDDPAVREQAVTTIVAMFRQLHRDFAAFSELDAIGDAIATAAAALTRTSSSVAP